jgi:hypothetical protein
MIVGEIGKRLRTPADLDLTGYAVVLRVRHREESAARSLTMTPDGASAYRDIEAGDFPRVGHYECQVHATRPGATVKSDLFTITVERSL